MLEQPPNPAPKRWGALSIVLFLLGMVILVPSGLCTGTLGLFYLIMASSTNETMMAVVTVLMYGGVPMLIGGVMVYLAFQFRRDK